MSGIPVSDILSGVVLLLVGILAWIGKKYADKVDEHEADMVRKRDLKELEDRIERSRQGMHAENQRLMQDINSNISRTGSRIDDLFRDLMRRTGGDR